MKDGAKVLITNADNAALPADSGRQVQEYQGTPDYTVGSPVAVIVSHSSFAFSLASNYIFRAIYSRVVITSHLEQLVDLESL